MAELATSSKLKKAFIQILNAQGTVKEEVPVLFNPTEYSMEKSNEFASVNIPGLESPMLQFSRGNLETLTMDLFFDSYEENKDVRMDYTTKITDLLKIDPDIHAPPILRFVWGSLNFTCVLSRVTKKFTMFRSDGIPVRATLSVTFNEYRTEVSAREKPKKSSDRTKTYTIKQGDSLWAIAAREYGDPASWRPIADKNRIANPRALEVGRAIIIPPLEE
jgi:LysM repeat protein